MGNMGSCCEPGKVPDEGGDLSVVGFASCCEPREDSMMRIPDWLGGSEQVSTSTAPHLAQYFNEMAQQQDEALEKAIHHVKDCTTLTSHELEHASRATMITLASHKATMVEKLRVHARNAFAYYDKDGNGVLDRQESQVCQGEERST